ncbi:hypothetical protein CGC21_28165 [Leishmania donovani]|uniref:Uncharacterized protein n=1 Tax=Leishmania donovani TaxID=5661 RepID=A0A504Y0A4_LEIDO|nr:hypothetical protein CGC21_28165 [Leishmania donovani]
MSKINATYSSGYYIAPDVDFRKLEEQQRQEQRGKRKHGGADHGGDDNVKRQTFAIPFDLICEHCHRRIARGSHVYANRRATDKRYLDSIRIWELEILCRFCKGKYYLRTDPETPKDTGGYICEKGCKRVEGDFYSLNKQNQAAREGWGKAKAEAELNPLAALERENEAARELEERNRQIEEAVEERAGHDDGNLLTMLRSRPRRTEFYKCGASIVTAVIIDELRRVLARYGGDRRATAEAVTTTLVQAQEPNVLQAPASASCPTPMTTSAPAVAPKKSSIKQNKFFVCNNDNDDDIDDADAEESLLARLRGPPPPKPAFVSAARATSAVSITAGATPCAQPASRFATPAGASQPPPPPRKCGSSLLRRLVDDEDDEDGAD